MAAEFHWLIEGKLAGSAKPGLWGDLAADLDFLRRSGIRHIVTLTEDPLPELPEGWDFQVHHFPVDDMGIPTPRQAEELCSWIFTRLAQGEPVLLHCKAGLGRTGTLLGCCLVSDGLRPEQALTQLRRICRNYVQSDAQRRFLSHYALYLEQLCQERDEAEGPVTTICDGIGGQPA